MRPLAFARALALAATLITVTTPPAATADPPRQLVAAFIGDSYTIGYGIPDPSLRWSTIVARKMGWEERNFGRGGTGYATPSSKGPIYRGMLDQVADVHPDIVVVAGGLNDRRVFASNPADVAHAVMDTFHQLRDRLPQAQIVAIGPTFFADVTPELVAFDQFVEDAADSVGAEFVSLISPTPVLRAEMFLPDHLHVDEAGHSAIADRILSTLAIQEGAPHGT